MPPNVSAYLLVMLVPVIVLAGLNVGAIEPTVELKAALVAFTGAGATALGFGLVRDTARVRELEAKSERRIDHATRGRVRVITAKHPVASSSSAETTRAAISDVHPTDSKHDSEEAI